MPYQKEGRPKDASIRLRRRTRRGLARVLYNKGWWQRKDFTWDKFIRLIAKIIDNNYPDDPNVKTIPKKA